jgi:hypothetical protein
MTDWTKIEAALDDQSIAHGCVICGGVVRQGDETRWGIAVRPLHGRVLVTWVHGPCFVDVIDPKARPGFLTAPIFTPPA